MYRSHVLVCGGTGCTSSGSETLISLLQEELKKNGLENEVAIVKTGCHGLCAQGPVMVIYPDATFYSMVKPEDIPEIVSEHLLKGSCCYTFIICRGRRQGQSPERYRFLSSAAQSCP